MIVEGLYVIIGGIIGLTSSYIMWKMQTRYEKKNVAHALYLELSSLEGSLGAFAKAFVNPPPGVSRDAPVIINQPFYSEGLFLSFKKEIASFNNELSSNLFQFYILLLRAEEYRQISEDDLFFDQANKAMRDNIVKGYSLLPDLKKLLVKECQGAQIAYR